MFALQFLLCIGIGLCATAISAADIDQITSWDVGHTDDVPASKYGATVTVQGEPIDTGVIVFHGEYLDVPYFVGRRGDDLTINNRRVRFLPSTLGFWDIDQSAAGRSPHIPQALLVNLLVNGALIIIVDNTCVDVIASHEVLSVLRIINATESNQWKVSSLLREGYGTLDTNGWTTVVEQFTEDLPEGQRFTPVMSSALRSEGPHFADVGFGSKPNSGLVYSATLIGMLLAAFGFSTVMSYQPDQGRKWSERHSSEDAQRFVIRAIFVLTLLGIFDLLCTHAANQSGGFLELNPIAAHLLQSPLALVTYKAVLTILGAGILLRLKVYRGAQVACWWLCVICTLVAARWVTYSSLFIA